MHILEMKSRWKPRARRIAVGAIAAALVFAPLHASVRYAPMAFSDASGTRPFLDLAINDHPFKFMLHVGASFFLMTTHANAQASGLVVSNRKSDVGIDREGHVSNLGLGTTTIASLVVGPSKLMDVHATVFEVPIPGLAGMIGTLWIRKVGLIVDYNQARVGFPDAPADARSADAALLRQGYTPHAMRWNASSSTWFVLAKINGHDAELSVSGVTNDTLDLPDVQAAGMEIGPQVSEEAGPRGAVVPDYILKRPTRLAIDGQEMAVMQPRVHDIGTYLGISGSRAHGLIHGWLGSAFVLANDVVVDYGTSTLFVRTHRRS